MYITTVTVLLSCGSESGQKLGSAADGILAGGAAVLVVGVVLLVSAIVLCATMPVIRKRMCVAIIYNYNGSTYSVKYKFTGLDVLEHKDGHLEIINPIQQGHIALEFMCFGTLATPTINPIMLINTPMNVKIKHVYIQ